MPRQLRDTLLSHEELAKSIKKLVDELTLLVRESRERIAKIWPIEK